MMAGVQTMSGTLTFVPLIYAGWATLHPIQFGSKQDCRRIAKVMQMTDASVMRLHCYLIKLGVHAQSAVQAFPSRLTAFSVAEIGATVERAGDAI
jgi:hypothetical protein